MDLRRFGRIVKPMVGIALVVGVWQYWAGVRSADSIILPAPSAIWAFGADEPGMLLDGAWSTLKVVAVGFVIAFAAGVVLALVFELSQLLRDMFLPLLVVTQVTPVVAVAPLLIIWLGFGEAPKIAVVVLISFFPILVSTLSGFQEVPDDMRQVARGVDASRWKTLRRLTLPNAIPFMLSGARIAITLSVVGAVVGEFVAADSGLGFLILRGSAQIQPELMWAAVLMLAVLGLTLFNLVRLVEVIALPWKRTLGAASPR